MHGSSNRLLGTECSQIPPDHFPVGLRNQLVKEVVPDQLIRPLSEVAAEGLVDEGERSIGQEPANEFRLVFDNGAISRLRSPRARLIASSCSVMSVMARSIMPVPTPSRRSWRALSNIFLWPIAGNTWSTAKSSILASCGSSCSSNWRNLGMFHWPSPSSKTDRPSVCFAGALESAGKSWCWQLSTRISASRTRRGSCTVSTIASA